MIDYDGVVFGVGAPRHCPRAGHGGPASRWVLPLGPKAWAPPAPAAQAAHAGKALLLRRASGKLNRLLHSRREATTDVKEDLAKRLLSAIKGCHGARAHL